MNKVILIGNLTADPEIRTTTTGAMVATFTVAVNRPYTNQSGKREADFIRCVAFGKAAENLEKYTEKGSKVAVEGRLESREYTDKKGIDRKIWEVYVDSIEYITWKQRQKQQEFEARYAQPSYYNSSNQQTTEIDDDILPF